MEPNNNTPTPSIPPTDVILPPPTPEIKPEWAEVDQNLINQPVNQPTTSTIHEIPKKKNNKFVLILIFALVLIALGALGVLAYQKYFAAKPVATTSPTPTATPDPTADWKTYESENYGFSFKYPYLGYSICPETDFFSIFEEKDLNCDGIVYEIPLVSFRSYWAEDLSKQTPISTRKISAGNVQIDINRYQFVSTSYGVSTTNIIEVATIPLKDKDIQLYAFGDISNFQKREDLLDQIISTFKFTN